LISEYGSDLTSNKAINIIDKIKKIDEKIFYLRNEETKETRLLNFNLVSSVLFTLSTAFIITVLFDRFLTVEILKSAFENFPFLQNQFVFLVFV
jgi:hypothetical protein